MWHHARLQCAESALPGRERGRHRSGDHDLQLRPQGNQISVAAPLSRNTANAYDELNRLKQITDPANGITQFGYDANENLTTVADPEPHHLVQL